MTTVEQDIDYIVKVTEEGVEGLWLCIVCGITNRNFGVLHFHVKFDHSEIKCRFCNTYCQCYFSMEAHMQEAHSDQIPIECQICKIWLPDATALQPHLQWHGDPNRSLIPHQYAEECANCHMFLAHGRESSDHRAFCVMKLDPDMRDCRQASGTPEPAVMTHQGRDSAPTRTLRQIVRETLRGTTHSNAATMYQTAATGPCPASMSHKTEPDEQEIEIIPGDSRYWEQFEEEVQYNSGRNSITSHNPQ